MRIPFLGGIGVPELIIILIVVLLIFGPKNLPKLGNAIGKTFKSLRDGMDGKKKDDAAADVQETPQVETVEEAVVEEATEPEKAPASKAE